MSPMFFVAKKYGKKQIVQNYCYVNSRIVKNKYPLLLTSDYIDTIESKKVFIKLDLWWGYNNVHIKEGDEWKVVFTMPIRSYEPMMMFFGLTNLPAIF